MSTKADLEQRKSRGSLLNGRSASSQATSTGPVKSNLKFGFPLSVGGSRRPARRDRCHRFIQRVFVDKRVKRATINSSPRESDMDSDRRDFLKSSAIMSAAMAGVSTVLGVSAAEAQTAPPPSADAQAIQKLYDGMEKAFITGDVNGITSLASSNFRSIGPDGSINDLEKWKSDMAADLSATKYTEAIFTIEKATVNNNNAIVYLSKKYLGTVKLGKFDTTVSVRDVLTKQDAAWKIAETEIVKRTVSRVGPAMQTLQTLGTLPGAASATAFSTIRLNIAPQARPMVQGCGDE